jgi:PDZ domain-containing protein
LSEQRVQENAVSFRTRERLANEVASMLALESHIGAVLGPMSEQAGKYTEASDALKRFAATTRAHETTLQVRLEKIGGKPGYGASFQSLQIEKPGVAPPISALLQSVSALLSRATMGYAILHVIAHRFFDSQGDGNTADLAENHLRDYAKMSLEISQLLSDTVVWDLGQAGLDCQCQCPSCSLGVCLCSPHGTNTLDQILRDTMQADPVDRQGILVRPPKKGSPASQAGLQPGDTVLTIDGQEVGENNLGAVQATVKRHESGEDVRLHVRRRSGETQEFAVTR